MVILRMFIGLMIIAALCLGVVAFIMHFTSNCKEEMYLSNNTLASSYSHNIGPVAPAGSLTVCSENQLRKHCKDTHYGCGNLQGGDFYPCDLY